MKRDDPHRPGAIVPADYAYVFSYNLPTTLDGWPLPALGINCEIDRRKYDEKGRVVSNGEHAPDGRCCVVGLRASGARFAATGGTGKCSICGALFVYGDVWQHVPSGEYVHLGHTCADKYEMLADRSAWEIENGRARDAAAAKIARRVREEARAAFLAENPGLDADLALDHRILADLDAKLRRWGSLTEPQVALARKIAFEVRNPRPAEVMVEAPEGSAILVRGKVVSVKTVESAYGETLKFAVKVSTPAGVWIAWSTVPAGLPWVELRDREVEFVANLVRGREAHFAIAKRPRKARLLDEPAAAPAPDQEPDHSIPGCGHVECLGINCDEEAAS